MVGGRQARKNAVAFEKTTRSASPSGLAGAYLSMKISSFSQKMAILRYNLRKVRFAFRFDISAPIVGAPLPASKATGILIIHKKDKISIIKI